MCGSIYGNPGSNYEGYKWIGSKGTGTTAPAFSSEASPNVFEVDWTNADATDASLKFQLNSYAGFISSINTGASPSSNRIVRIVLSASTHATVTVAVANGSALLHTEKNLSVTTEPQTFEYDFSMGAGTIWDNLIFKIPALTDTKLRIHQIIAGSAYASEGQPIITTSYPSGNSIDFGIQRFGNYISAYLSLHVENAIAPVVITSTNPAYTFAKDESDFSSSITINSTGCSSIDTSYYVRLNYTNSGTYSGEITYTMQSTSSGTTKSLTVPISAVIRKPQVNTDTASFPNYILPGEQIKIDSFTVTATELMGDLKVSLGNNYGPFKISLTKESFSYNDIILPYDPNTGSINGPTKFYIQYTGVTCNCVGGNKVEFTSPNLTTSTAVSLRFQRDYTTENKSIADNEGLSGIIAFPNPVATELHIEFSESMEGNIEVTIVDLLGQEKSVLKKCTSCRLEGKYTYDAENLPNGIYQLTFKKDGNTIKSEKLILVK
ncbi:MAG: T9SS type A sorting domain-containing protein [Cytophagaceae bacterium]|nr:T9SS type A sorting domain-containing protein [Cytophagaceae bacterium]